MIGARPARSDRAPRPPAGLSGWAQGVWRTLLSNHDFAEHELVAFTRALRWWDVADTLLSEAETLVGRERDAKFKAAGDASTSALRCWKTLKFTDDATRRPGRPSGPRWSAARRAAAEL
jgi:hypothetical protein